MSSPRNHRSRNNGKTRYQLFFSLVQSYCVLYAQWGKNSGGIGTGTNGTAKPTNLPKTGDNSNLASCFALLLIGGGALTATAVIGSNKKRSER